MIINGTFNDASPLNQPQGLASFLLNMNSKINVGSQTSDYGHELLNDLAASYGTGKILGSIVISNDKQVLFYRSAFNYILYKNGDSIQQVLSDSSFTKGLEFDDTTSVHGVFKLNSQRDIIIYFVYNGFFRWLNINNPLSTLDANQLNVFQGLSSIANLANTSKVIDFNGGLESGMYYIALTYLDEYLNADNYFYISNPFPVIRDNVSLNYSNIQGCAPKTPTNKAIQLDIKDIDTDKKYIRVVAIPYIDGILQTPRVIKDLPIISSTETFIYTGSEVFTEISLENVLIDRAKYSSVETIQSIDGTHYIGGLSKSTDIGLQPYVNNIKLECITSNYEFEDNTTVNTYKGQLNIFNKTFKQGEVYAFYLTGTLKKTGEKTFAYHIPARKAKPYVGNVFNEANITLDGMTFFNYADANDLKTKYGNSYKGYKLLETSVDTATDFAFWENENEQYPNTNDFLVFDNTGTQIDDFRGENVRHHRFPNNANNQFSFVYKSGSETRQRVLGIRLPALNTIFPQEVLNELASVEIHYAKRNGTNNLWQGSSIYVFSTTGIFDSGGLAQTDCFYTVGDNRVYRNNANHFKLSLAGNQAVRIYPVDNLINKSDIQADYVKIPLWYYVSGSNVSQVGNAIWGSHSSLTPIGNLYNNILANGVLFKGDDFYIRTNQDLSGTFSEGLIRTTIGVKSLSPLIPAGSRVTFNDSLYTTLNYIENSASQSTIQLVLDRPINRGNRGNTSPVTSIVCDSNFNDTDTDVLFRYDINNNAYFSNSGYGVGLMEMYALKSDCYLYWNTQELVNTGTVITDFDVATDIYGGDVFNNNTFFRVSSINKHNGNDWYTETGYYYPTQSASNIGFRYVTDAGQSRFYPINSMEAALGQTGFQNEEIISYNKDYTKLNDLKSPVSKPDNFVEISNFETTIARSEKDNSESFVDNNRIYLANNYMTLPYRGKIKNLGKFQNVLIPHFEQAILKTLGREQLDIQGSIVQLGKGDLFAIPPKEVLLTNAGFGGIEYRQSACSTPYGYFYVDTVGKKIFVLADGLEEISEYGYRNFFNERLNFSLEQKLSSFGATVDQLAKISVENGGIGVLCFYDALYKRVFVTVKDYEPITNEGSYYNQPLTESSPELGINVLVFYNGKFYRTVDGLGIDVGSNTILPVSYTNETYFINKSFTMSYNMVDKKWNGFHSFLPTHGYDVQDGYRVVDNSRLYLGNVKGNGYFGSPNMEVIVEVIFNGLELESKRSQFISITCSLLNNQDVRILPEIDNYSMYNSFQASGNITGVRANPFNPYSGNYWYSVKNLFINKFRDYLVDKFQPMFSNEIYPTLKDYNSDIILQSMPAFKAGKFVDKWAAVRFKVTLNAETFVLNDVSLVENFEKLS